MIEKSLLDAIIPKVCDLIMDNKNILSICPDVMLNENVFVDKRKNSDLASEVDLKKKTITFGLKYLIGLWSTCYYSTVIYNMMIVKQLNGVVLSKYDKDVLDKAEDIYKWGRSLYLGYVEYTDNIDCILQSDEGKYASSMFCIACEFILCHELGHIKLNHCKSGDNGQEIQADAFSYNLLVKGLNEKGMKAYNMGCMLALCGLLLWDKQANIASGTHPASIKRIEFFMKRLQDDDDNSEIWIIACLLLFDWNWTFLNNLFVKNEQYNFKQEFFSMCKNILNLSK